MSVHGLLLASLSSSCGGVTITRPHYTTGAAAAATTAAAAAAGAAVDAACSRSCVSFRLGGSPVLSQLHVSCLVGHRRVAVISLPSPQTTNH